jgi:hypothetical protein
VAAAAFAVSEVASMAVRHYLPLLQVHWIIRPILGVAHVENPDHLLGASLPGRLLYTGAVVLAGFVSVRIAAWAASVPRWHTAGIGLLLGGGAANTYEVLVLGSVTDWITFRPLVLLNLHQGFPTYNLGDASIGAGVVVLVSLLALQAWQHYRGPMNGDGLGDGEGGGGAGDGGPGK